MVSHEIISEKLKKIKLPVSHGSLRQRTQCYKGQVIEKGEERAPQRN